jgi:tRNA(adenine34) deaminase
LQQQPAAAGGAPGAPQDEAFMRLALAEAAAAAAAGEVPVGAVLVDAAGHVVAAARNRTEADGSPLAHAELLAIQSAAATAGGWRLAGCTLYVTLEPCPMCAGAVLNARLRRLVYGAPSPRLGADGGWVRLLPPYPLAAHAAARAAEGAEEVAAAAAALGVEAAADCCAELAAGGGGSSGEWEGDMGEALVEVRRHSGIGGGSGGGGGGGGGGRASNGGSPEPSSRGAGGHRDGGEAVADGEAGGSGRRAARRARVRAALAAEELRAWEASGAPRARVEPLAPHPFHPDLQVSRGVLRDECTALLQSFFRRRRAQAAAAAAAAARKQGRSGDGR